MVFKIIWSEEAYNTFLQNIDYLKLNWIEKEINKFIDGLKDIISRIEKYPESYPASKKKLFVRKAKINKHITLYYHEMLNELNLITFWHSKQNPDKLKY